MIRIYDDREIWERVGTKRVPVNDYKYCFMDEDIAILWNINEDKNAKSLIRNLLRKRKLLKNLKKGDTKK